LSQVKHLEQRRREIEDELNRVWVQGGAELEAPEYVEEDLRGRRNEKEVEDGEEFVEASAR